VNTKDDNMTDYLRKVEKTYKKFIKYVEKMEDSIGNEKTQYKIKANEMNVRLRKLLKQFRGKT